MGKQKYNILCLRIERKTWIEIPTDIMDKDARRTYEKRKTAVDMYIDGYSTDEIKTETGCTNTTRLISRCLQINDDGYSYGYSALLPYANTSGYTKKSDSSANGGLFKKLLITYPELDELIIACCRNDKKTVVNRNMPAKEIHELFLDKCRELGIQDTEYPLNTTNKALRSVERYILFLRKNDVEASMAFMDNDARQRFKSTGFLRKLAPFPCMPYSDIHIDGHKLDVLYVVKVDDGDGMYHFDIAMRPWLITVLELKTVTVLGYHLTQNEEYTQTDILKAIQHAILPKKRYSLDESSVLKYPQNGGWADTAYPCLEYAVWDCIMLDNALAHQSINVTKKLLEDLGMTVSFGPVATPTVRPNIERSFGTIEREALHRLPYTIGSSPDDERRNKNAGEAAIRDEFTFDKLQVYLDVSFCTYNNAPNRHNRSGVSPLEEIRRLCVNCGMVPVTADEAMIKKIEKLHYKTDVCTIRGNITSGRRPYFQWNRIEYRSDKISQNFRMLTDLNGNPQKVLIEYDPDNIRTVKCYTADTFEYVGEAYATGKWDFDHSESQHMDMLKLENKNNQVGNKFSMPANTYVKELQNDAQKNRRARTKAAIANNIVKSKERVDNAKMIPFPKTSADISLTSKKNDKEMIEEMGEAFASGLNTTEIYKKFYCNDDDM